MMRYCVLLAFLNHFSQSLHHQSLLLNRWFNVFQDKKTVKLQRNGAELTLHNITKHFQENLPEKIPELWNIMIGTLEKNLHDVPGE